MSYYPFFVNVLFECDEDPTILSQVRSVQLGYIGKSGLERTDIDCQTDDGWMTTAKWLEEFRAAYPSSVPVGWNLRNLVWPAVMANLARVGETAGGLSMPMEKKWNPIDMVDMRSVVLQGGYSDFDPSLSDVASFFNLDTVLDPIQTVYELYVLYQRVSL